MHLRMLAGLQGCHPPFLVLLTAVVAGTAVPVSADPPTLTAPPASQTIFLGDAVTFRVGAVGTEPLSYQWFRNGSEVPGATAGSYGFSTSVADDAASFTVRVANRDGAVVSPPAVLTIDFGMPGPAQTNRLIEVTNLWRYSSAKTDPGTAWAGPGYADETWPLGGGALYVEDSALPAPKTTALPFAAGSLPTTCYFRARFTNAIENPHTVRLLASALLDDGAVFHLNGAEAYRIGMPDGAVIFGTPANRTVGNAAWEGPLELASTNLLTGTNVIAAEVHQSGAGSSDVVLGLTLDAVWQPRLRDTAPPVLANVVPPVGAPVATLTQVEVQFSEAVRGVDAADLLVNGAAATSLTVLAPGGYVFRFPQPPAGAVTITWASDHGITDRSANTNAFGGAGFGYLLGTVSSSAQLAFARIAQSSDASSSSVAARAADGSTTTFSLTGDVVGSYWLAELGRPFPVDRIELVNRPAPNDAELGGLELRLLNLDDQVVYSTNLANPGSSGIALIRLPSGLQARSLWIGLPGAQSNHAGNHRVGLAEVRLFGTPDLPYGPPPATVWTNAVRVWQSSEYGGFPAENALDGSADTFTHTADERDSFWMADLGAVYPVQRVEIVNRTSCCDNRLSGLVLRMFDGASNSVASAVLPNPGLGATWTYQPTASLAARWVRVGLENGQTNGGGNRYVTLAEARVFSGTTNLLQPASTPVPIVTNLASFKRSYMVRLDNSVPPAANANDDNYATETKTTLRTVDGYWEVDLGATCALYGVRVLGASGIGSRLTNATVRLYNEAHESVFAQRLAGKPDVFDLDLNGPRFARYVRVGLEDKQRTDPNDGIEFYIGFREVEVFGRAADSVGIASFAASTGQVNAGESVTLAWAVDDVRRVELHPSLGSVGAFTATNGLGSLSLRLTNSTEFVLVASNAAGLFTRAATVQVDSAPPTVRLSELVAENRYALEDGYGEAPDWIEVRNPGNAPVDLGGWGLSDNPADPMKWTFPATNLAAHSSLVIFASGRGTPRDPAGRLHAGFRLEKNGGALVLTAPDGHTVVDQVAYPAMDTDLAYGRSLEGVWTFLEPTPDGVNAAPSYEGWVKAPDWSHARGFHESAFTLSLTNTSPGATLLYSLDGSAPSRPYTQPLSIRGTTVVRAAAVRPGHKPARVQTRTFLFVDDVITSSVMNTAITQNPAYAPRMKPGLLSLPSISICLPGQPEYEEREGSLEVLWPAGGDHVQVNCGISRFGNAWTRFAKRSIRMKCRARYGDARLHAPLFDGFEHGVPAARSFDELDFRSGSQDMNERGFYMAGRFVEDSMLDMGSLNPHGRYVHLYLNGVYWGQYDCRELLVEPFLADYLGGAKDDYVVVRGNDNVSDDFVIGAPEPPNIEPWERVLGLRNSYASVRPYLDVPHLIDFMLLWTYGDCESEYRSCGPLDAGSGFKFWIADADGFLRTSAMGSNRTSRQGPGGTFGSLVAEKHPDFKALLADRIYRHFFNNGALTPAANDARLAARLQEIRDSLLAECARWGYRTPANWDSAAATVRSGLFPGRTAQLLGYLRSAGLYPAFDPPRFDQFGGAVTNGYQPQLTTTTGTIYYTLDGTDPRSPGGAVSATAAVWAPGAIRITGDLTVNARVRNASGQWSALAQPRFLLAERRAPTARDLLVTEINYNPVGGEEHEFVELWNGSSNLLDLAGISLANAVRYTFPNGAALPPGGFVIVAHDPAAFAARYQDAASPWHQAGLAVVGPWGGALNNGGETLALVSSNGVQLAEVPFQAGGDWPERADGHGSTLELRAFPDGETTDAEVQASLVQGGNWGASSLYHGSPGRFDAFVKSARIHEIQPHAPDGGDWIELVNAGTQPTDLTGCALTDDLDQPGRWTFPAGTVLNPGQFLVLTASQLGFAFSDRGDDASLLQLNGTNVVRFLDTVDFPASSPAESLGVFLRSDGASDFTELRANTPGGPNALPRVGPVVLSELMFHPAPGKAAYLELANLSSVPVPLFDPAHPTNVWRIEGIGSFEFPPGTVLPACGLMIVCSTNPAAFRAEYDLSPAVPVLGPWPGSLAAEGETLRLLQPGLIELDGAVPLTRVDHVAFGINAPWPASSPGVSLERVPAEAYGNDPASWRPGPLMGTPGRTAANRPPVLHADGNLSVPMGSTLSLTLSVADPDAPWQTPSLWATRLPPGATFVEATGVLLWTPTEPQGPGHYEAEFGASDHAACGAGTALLTLTLEVEPTESLALSARVDAGGVWLSFPAVPGQTYQIEASDDLFAAGWHLLHDIPRAERDRITMLDAGPAGRSQRFYRVRWLR